MENQTPNKFAIWPTDRRFKDSPYPGDPVCICSRCGRQIVENDNPIRAWPEDGSYEYRYHPECMGFQTFDEVDIDREL